MQGRARDALPEIERVRSDWGRTWLYAATYAAQGREKESDAALKELIAKHYAASLVPGFMLFETNEMKRSSG
jgi:hypothetical protein